MIIPTCIAHITLHTLPDTFDHDARKLCHNLLLFWNFPKSVFTVT